MASDRRTPPEVDPATAMARALEVARRGPLAGGNPRVGCVLLDAAGRVLAEGHHEGAGTPHAETAALAALPAGVRPHTAVVTLEPCDHTGRTGPCSLALIEAGVRRVVYAVEDPGEASGGGAKRLAAAGIDVERGVLADEVGAELEPWLTAVRRGRPWVTVKWAATLDGRMAAADGSSQWITGPVARAAAHRLRADSDVVLTGTGTVLADDPAMTARDAAGALLDRQPLPVVVGATPVPGDARVRSHPRGMRQVDAPLDDVLADLFAAGARRVLVEAGPRLTSAVLAAGLADDLVVHLAPKLLGGPATATGDLGVGGIAEAIDLDLTRIERLGDDLAVHARAHHPQPRIPTTGG